MKETCSKHDGKSSCRISAGFLFILCGDIFHITYSICDIQIRVIPFKSQKKQRIKYILFQNTIDKLTCQAFKLLKK